MSTRLTLAGICLLAAFGLAACGGGGGTTASAPATPPVVDGMDGNGTVEPAAPSVADLFAVAHNTRADATAAVEAAAKAIAAATKAIPTIKTLAVAGDSAMAEANAKSILDAQTTATTAIATAEAQQKAAETALAAAMALPADTENRASLIDALETAIEAAKKQVAAATKQAEGPVLEAAVRAVTTSTTSTTKPMTAADHGSAVAKDIAGALGPTSTIDGTRSARAPHTTTIAAATEKTAVMMNNAKGKTWAQIVGADKVMVMPIGLLRVSQKVASIAGMTAAKVCAPEVIFPVTFTDGMEITAANYKGIPGNVYCLGTDCKVDDDGKLAGSWYFTPTSTAAYYQILPAAAAYTEETLYARFGHWLSLDNSNAVVVNTYAERGSVAGTAGAVGSTNTGRLGLGLERSTSHNADG